jgi:hypothetical protein
MLKKSKFFNIRKNFVVFGRLSGFGGGCDCVEVCQFVGMTGEQFAISLFILIPFVLLRENSHEDHDEQQGDQQREATGIEYHAGLFIPSGGKIDDDGYDEKQADGDTYEKLPEYLLPSQTIACPIVDKIAFFLAKRILWFLAEHG